MVLINSWKKANAKMEGVGEYKLKLKLDILFLPFAAEKEVEWDLKNILGDTWDRLKAIVKDDKSIKTLFVEE